MAPRTQSAGSICQSEHSPRLPCAALPRRRSGGMPCTPRARTEAPCLRTATSATEASAASLHSFSVTTGSAYPPRLAGRASRHSPVSMSPVTPRVPSGGFLPSPDVGTQRGMQRTSARRAGSPGELYYSISMPNKWLFVALRNLDLVGSSAGGCDDGGAARRRVDVQSYEEEWPWQKSFNKPTCSS